MSTSLEVFSRYTTSGLRMITGSEWAQNSNVKGVLIHRHSPNFDFTSLPVQAVDCMAVGHNG